jgi:hypothetical protein
LRSNTKLFIDHSPLFFKHNGLIDIGIFSPKVEIKKEAAEAHHGRTVLDGKQKKELIFPCSSHLGWLLLACSPFPFFLLGPVGGKGEWGIG